VLQPHQREKLARGAKLKEHAMSQKLNSGVAVGWTRDKRVPQSLISRSEAFAPCTSHVLLITDTGSSDALG
jgi:hypothetical protein